VSLMRGLVDASVATVRRSSYHFLPMTRGNPQAEPPITVDYPGCRCICHMRPKPDPSDAWSRLGEAEKQLLFGTGPWPDRSKEIL